MHPRITAVVIGIIAIVIGFALINIGQQFTQAWAITLSGFAAIGGGIVLLYFAIRG